jgi:hypothetical protein
VNAKPNYRVPGSEADVVSLAAHGEAARRGASPLVVRVGAFAVSFDGITICIRCFSGKIIISERTP